MKPSDGESNWYKAPSSVLWKCLTVKAKNKLRNLDEAKHEEGYALGGNLPYYFDYEDNNDEDSNNHEAEEQVDEEDNECDAGVVLPLEVHDIKEFAGQRLREELYKRDLLACGEKRSAGYTLDQLVERQDWQKKERKEGSLFIFPGKIFPNLMCFHL